MSLTEHAKSELELAGLFDKDSDYDGMIGEAVMELMEVFSKQEHSGYSAPRVSSIFKTLADYEPLRPITCDDNEWGVAVGENTFQNKRLSSVFKEGKEGKPYYLDAIVFRGQNGSCFTGSSTLKDGSEIYSRQFIKTPFKPKSFYIDVIETEWYKDKEDNLTKKKGGGWWTSVVKDESQLDEVFKYYDR
jgi:hypothetical protein